MNTFKTSKTSLTKTAPLIAFLFLGWFAWAQSGTKRVSVDPLSPLVIKRGSTSEASAQVIVEPGAHVNSNKPAGEFLIPFRLEWEAGPVTATSISYPVAERLQVGPDKLLVYTGTFAVKTAFRASESAPLGTTQLRGRLHFQACNSQMCFRPATLDLVLPATVE